MDIIDLTFSPEFGASRQTREPRKSPHVAPKPSARTEDFLSENDEILEVLPPVKRSTSATSGRGFFSIGRNGFAGRSASSQATRQTNVPTLTSDIHSSLPHEDREATEHASARQTFQIDEIDSLRPAPGPSFNAIPPRQIPEPEVINLFDEESLNNDDEAIFLSNDSTPAEVPPPKANLAGESLPLSTCMVKRPVNSFARLENSSLLGLPTQFIGKRRSPCGKYSFPVTSSMCFAEGNRKRKRDDQEQDKIQTIYSDSRRPVKALKRQLEETVAEIQCCGYRKGSEEWIDANQRKNKLTKQLIHAEQNARECVYSLMNNNPFELGSPGSSDNNNQQRTDSDGCPIVDLHGLHVREALQAFDERVVPFLSSVKAMTLITGWGKHSKNGRSALQESVKQHIRLCPNIVMQPVPNNRGRIRVRWIESQS